MSGGKLRRPRSLGELPPLLGEAVATLRRGMKLAWRASPGFAVALWGLVAIQAVAPGAQTWLVKLLLDDIAAAHGVPSAAGRVWTEAGLYAALALGLQLAALLAMPLRDQLAERLHARGELLLLEALERHQGLALFEDPAFQDDREIARGKLSHALREVLFLVPTALENAVVLATMLFFLGRFSPWLPLGLVAVTLPRFRFEWELYKQAWTGITGLTPQRRWMSYCREVLLTDRDAKEVRLFGLGEYFLQRYQEAFDLAQRELMRLRTRLAVRSGAFGLAGSAIVGGAYVLIVMAAARGRLTVGDIALYGAAVFQAASRLESLARLYGFLADHTLTLQRFFRLLDAEPTLPIRPPGQGVSFVPPLRRGIALENVSFTYPGADRPALQGVSLVLPAGRTVALVGENGAGKSTIVKLLTRLYDPTGGAVLVDGVPLPDYDLASLRRGMAVVFQDFVQYALTARENIAVGDIRRREDDRAVLRAAARSGANAVIAELPAGLDQPLGKQFQDGVELSGGQWQTLALARAFLREDAGILILDEPTAALDARTEYEIFRRFAELAEGRTVLLVSHRFSTVRMADWIVVLDGGRVREQGTHADLMAARGLYADLYEMQAERYQ